MRNMLLGYELRPVKTGFRGFSTRSDTNQPVQSQEKAKDLKFWIYK